MSKYLAFQTGTDRKDYFKDRQRYIDLGKHKIVSDHITKYFLKHSDEAKYEGLDFFDTFKQWLLKVPEQIQEEGYDKDISNYKFNVFLSIGSTSTQGWRLINSNSGEITVKPIIPSHDDNSGLFELCGVLKAPKDEMKTEGCLKHFEGKEGEEGGTHFHTTLMKELDLNTDRVLCFNAIGYGLTSEIAGASEKETQAIDNYEGEDISDLAVKSDGTIIQPAYTNALESPGDIAKLQTVISDFFLNSEDQSGIYKLLLSISKKFNETAGGTGHLRLWPRKYSVKVSEDASGDKYLQLGAQWARYLVEKPDELVLVIKNSVGNDADTYTSTSIREEFNLNYIIDIGGGKTHVYSSEKVLGTEINISGDVSCSINSPTGGNWLIDKEVEVQKVALENMYNNDDPMKHKKKKTEIAGSEKHSSIQFIIEKAEAAAAAAAVGPLEGGAIRRNKSKRNKSKRNKSKRNKSKRNKSKRNKSKRNKSKRNKSKRQQRQRK